MNHEPSATPRLLISVRSADEVIDALAGGADWIDLKEPNSGPLAAVDARVAREAVETLDRRRTMSAALGELRDWDCGTTRELLAIEGISVVKLGLAGCAQIGDWQQQWQAVAEDAAEQNKQLVAVIYADWQRAAAPTPEEILDLAQLNNCNHLLIDTYDKSVGSTLDHLSGAELKNIQHQATQVGMEIVVAGSISLELLSQLPLEIIDMVAVRGAVCRGDRTTRVDAKLVSLFRQALIAQSGTTVFA